MRRWQPREYEVNGLRFRVVPGKKVTKLGEPGKDLRLDVWVGEWRAVHMHLGGFLADFFHENEEVLYPTHTVNGIRTPWKGGTKYLAYIYRAAKYGWEKAEAELRIERQQKGLFDDADAL